MNIKKAKTIPLEMLLEKLGYQPDHSRRADVWYLSPFRTENKASFKINTEMNVWFDHGAGVGGDVVKFVQTLYKIDVSDALKEIERLVGSDAINAPEPKKQQRLLFDKTVADITTEITDVRPLQAKSLLTYLRDRGIDPHIASQFVAEVHYCRGKSYFAIGFATDSKDSYELRNRYFKGCIGPKDITSLGLEPSCKSIDVYEGFMDFLTATTLNRKAMDGSVILNSTSMTTRAINAIHQLVNLETVALYRDNDEAGQRLLHELRHQLPSKITVIDKAMEYQGFKDLNEFHVQKQSARSKVSRN